MTKYKITTELLITYAEGRLDNEQTTIVEQHLETSTEAREKLEEIKMTLNLTDEAATLLDQSIAEDDIGFERFYEHWRSSRDKYKKLRERITFDKKSKKLPWWNSIVPNPQLAQVAFASFILVIGFGIGRFAIPTSSFDPSSVFQQIQPNNEEAFSFTSGQTSKNDRVTYNLVAEDSNLVTEVSDPSSEILFDPVGFEKTLIDILNDRNALALIITEEKMYEVDIKGQYKSGTNELCEIGEIKMGESVVSTFIGCKTSADEWKISYLSQAP